MNQTNIVQTQMFPFERLMQLPALEIKEKKEKRYVRKLEDIDLGVLKPQQLKAFEEMKAYIKEGQRGSYHLLEGFAGTGKTYTMSVFVEWLLNQDIKRGRARIALTAPTNKAVKVQYEMAEYKDAGLNYITVHSLLGLREKIDQYGNQTFVQLSKDHAKIEDYDVLIIDEGSMLPDELMLLIDADVQLRGTKVIFMGDPCQIPPIGCTDSIPFTAEGRAQYNIGVSTLTEIVRQTNGNPIINLSFQVRENLSRHASYRAEGSMYNEETLDGFYFIDANLKKEFYALLERYFASENFKEDARFCKVIAWTNKVVDMFNAHIRKLIYRDEPVLNKIMIGEKLVANGPIIDQDAMDKNNILFNNNDEFVVEDAVVDQDVFRGVELTYYHATVRRSLAGLFGYTSETKKIKILHENSEAQYYEILDTLAELAKKAPKGYESAQKWTDFYRFQENFADVKYNYAITCHKSQGSSYQNAFVFESDINKSRKVVERNRIKYTAFTRPVSKLFILN